MPHSCHPSQSINFITAHDGFSLYDLVAYNQKHNEANGHNSTDGTNDNNSWNCGHEGDNNVSEEIMKLRKKQLKNFITLMMLSNGVPMIVMGDEMANTQNGNNNPYNQDNETSWLNWERKEKFADAFRFFKLIIAFRKKHPSICRHEFWKEDVEWFGVGKDVDFSYTSHTLAYHLKGGKYQDTDLYVMINCYWQPLEFQIQRGQPNGWKRVVDTGIENNNDIVDPSNGNAAVISNLKYTVQPRSIVVLEKVL
jgi:glycogen operon protein